MKATAITILCFLLLQQNISGNVLRLHPIRRGNHFIHRKIMVSKHSHPEHNRQLHRRRRLDVSLEHEAEGEGPDEENLDGEEDFEDENHLGKAKRKL